MLGSHFIDQYENTYTDLHKPAIIIAGCFVFMSLTLSLLLILDHLRSYNNPAEQKWVVAVLFMVPVYASESLVSLLYPHLSFACDILRNCYEAFALYSFGSYLISCLGGERKVIELLEDESRNEISNPLLEGESFPEIHKRRLYYFIFRPYVLGKDLLTIEKFGLVQYMIWKMVCALLAVILEYFGVYGDGEFKWYYGYPYITVVLNFSQMWALFCLVQFYNVTHDRLKSIKPLAKFISFKAIVFATWWQGVGIALLCSFHVLPRSGKFQSGLQDFLICIEMAIAALAHIFVFSAKPYHFLPTPQHGKISEFSTQRSEEFITIEEGGEEKSAFVENRETEIEAPGTSVKESVHDIVVEGGHKVVKDVVLTINQAIQPVEKGMNKIHETFQHISVSSPRDNKEEETQVIVEKHEKHEEMLTGDGSQVIVSEQDKVVQKGVD